MTSCSHCSYIVGVLLPEGARQALIDAPRWLFLAILVYAPWAYGCTTPFTIDLLEFFLYAASLLWFTGLAFRTDRPAIPPFTILCAAILLWQGWWMAANAQFYHNPNSHEFFRVPSFVPWAPGAVDGQVAFAMMMRVTGLLFAFFIACDMAAFPAWRWRIWWTVGLTSLSLLLLGLLQKATDAPMIFWEARNAGTELFFATYYYHGNAASYINLVFPLVAGLAILSIRDEDAHGTRALWISTLFLLIAGAAVNVSRSGQVVTLLLIVSCAISAARQVENGPETFAARAAIGVYAAVGLAALVALVLSAGWERPFEKWHLLQHQFTGENPRLLANRAAMRMLPDAGWFGFGPGEFALAFPHYTQALGRGIAGTWRYTHQDYLQTLIEWGRFGAFFWASFFLGGLAKCFINSQSRALSRADRLLLFGAGLGLTGAAIHAFVDFPFQIASLQLYIGTYLALGWSSSRWAVKTLPPARRSHARG